MTPMVPSRAEKERREASIQFRKYEKWRQERRLAVFKTCENLESMLKGLTLESGGELIDYCKHREWNYTEECRPCDVLAAIDDAIVKLRVIHGMPPMDDSLPGEEPTAFEQIRKILTSKEQHSDL
jgi:hypothetical protein